MYTVDIKSRASVMSDKKLNNDFKYIDKIRLNAALGVREKRQKLNEQYFTPAFVSEFIAKYIVNVSDDNVSILDVAAGVGNLGAVTTLSLCNLLGHVDFKLDAVEIDDFLSKDCLNLFGNVFKDMNVEHAVFNEDFFTYFKNKVKSENKYSLVLMNPPYKKIGRKDYESLDISGMGVEYSPNLYSLMMSCGLELLQDGGELIAIIPRSFCNGALFKAFRKKIVSKYTIAYLHLFESRSKVFSFDGVQQETVIIKVVKEKQNGKDVKISFGDRLTAKNIVSREFSKVVFKSDEQSVIHIPHLQTDDYLINKILTNKETIDSLGLKISTGKIVDFRNVEHITSTKHNNAWLFCKENLGEDCFLLPQNKFSNYLSVNDATRKSLLDKQCHLILNRIYFKERNQVINSQVVDITGECHMIAVENHLNYISGKDDSPLSFELAVGLKCYLESDLVSSFFRRFLGSTQINAADIKSLPFPTKRKLLNLAKRSYA